MISQSVDNWDWVSVTIPSIGAVNTPPLMPANLSCLCTVKLVGNISLAIMAFSSTPKPGLISLTQDFVPETMSGFKYPMVAIKSDLFVVSPQILNVSCLSFVDFTCMPFTDAPVCFSSALEDTILEIDNGQLCWRETSL